METQKRVKQDMGKFDKFQKIKMFDYPNCDYTDVKKLHFRRLLQGLLFTDMHRF